MARLRHTLFACLQLANAHALLKRAFWVFILVLHVGAIRSTWFVLDGMSDNAEWLSSGFRFLALIGSAVFFALKIADVSWLRLRPGWRSFISSLMIVALLHVNAVQRLAAGERMSSPTPLSAVLFVAVLVDVGAVRRQGLHLWNSVGRASKDRTRRQRRRSYPCNAAWPEAAIPPHSWLALGLLTPRPPPLA